MAMPPPPIPQRVSAPNTTPVMDRRGANYSDISMHAGCTSFPSCMSEDVDGRLIHVDNPSTVIKGKKEGSSPSKRK